MKKVVIVGGGLAGLTTAFYLSKNPNYSIELYESRETLGGRVQTVEVDGFKFNYGAFMIFPWYKGYHQLLHDLRYTPTLDPINLDKEYSWNKSTASFHTINTHWTFDDAEVKTLIKSLPTFLTHSAQLYNPDPNRFNRLSVKEYIKNLNEEDVKAIDVVNKLIVGYTYGAIDELPLAIYFGFAKEILLHGGFKHVQMIHDGADKIVQKLSDSLIDRGVKINLSSKVEIQDSQYFYCGERQLEADYFVVASAEGALLESFLKPISSPIIYNDHYAALIKTRKPILVNGKDDWNIVYTGTINEEQPQLTCVANISHSMTAGPENTYLTYLRVPTNNSNIHDDDSAKTEITHQIASIFEPHQTITIESLKHWKHTMPLVSLDALEQIQSMQGQKNIYFAGDYLGAPSMEVAIQSGRAVAAAVDKSD